MTPGETTTLARLARACCPQQHFDEYTPDAWHDLLGDLDFNDCRQALVVAAQAKPFVSPAEIRTEVKRIRHDRTKNADLAPPPPADARDYSAQLRAQVAALADGKTTHAVTAGTGDRDASPGERSRELLEKARHACTTASANRNRN